ncbi:CHASE domain-containing protein [Desulfoferrobacter suflitae]|uniref:CHASE domain-containing protein n=1 Tax=Desulfoferrobacter suflitae TaxID=2865782 RepID=UPI00216445BC|nr:CHASE domain-containing protein [Desulfoferrobacter suflitae]MCK8601877.1 PAS domain S-box protein [Desulfoferrobacter suflitae]
MNNDARPKELNGSKRRILIVLAVMLVVGGLFTWDTVNRTDRQMRQNLLFKARLVADTVNLRNLRALSGTAADFNKPSYLRLKHQFACVRASDQKCRFLYLMGRREDGSVFFFVDSEPVGSKDESPAGQTFDEITAEDLRPFEEKIALTPGPTADRWGTWVSALVPIVDPETGDLLAVLGVDYDARDWSQLLVRASLPPMLFTLTMTAMFVGGSVLLARHGRTTALAARRSRCLEPILTVAAAGLFLTVLVAWLAHQKEAEARYNAFQQLAYGKTAEIAETLYTLRNVELEAIARYFESSDYISPREFRDYTRYLVENRAVRAWGWSQSVRAEDKEKIESRELAAGVTQFVIWQGGDHGKRTVAAGRDVYYPVTRVAPFEENQGLLGYDLGSEPLCRKALEEAMRTGFPACTDPLTPVQGTDDEKAALVFHPVFSEDGPARLLGFATATLRMGDVLKSAHSDRVAFLDLTMGRPDGPGEFLAASWSDGDRADCGLSVTRPIFVFGEVFLVTAHAGPAFLSLYPDKTGWLTAAAGVMLTTLLVVLTGIVYRERELLEEMVSVRTRQLEEARDRIELAVQGADLGTWDWNVQTNEVIFNENWVRKLGLTLDETRQRANAWKEMVHPDDLPAVMKAMAAHIKGETGSYDMEHRLRHKAGHYIWVLVKGRMLKRDADGNPLHVCGTYLDITQRKHTEEALVANEERLRMLIDTLPDLIWLKDPKGVYVTCNQRFERFFGSAESQIIGKTDYDFLRREQADSFRDKDEAVIAAGKPGVSEEEITYADGHRELVETIRTPIYDSRGKIAGVLGIGRDITERRRMEQERHKLHGQLLQAQKMEAVGRLAGGVAHDLNNLLSPIIGYGEMLLADLGVNDRSTGPLSQILRAAFRARDLVRQLLSFSRRQPLEFKPVDVNRTIEDFKNLLLRTIPEDIEITLVTSPDISPVLADVGQIEQVIMNLAVNAADAMPGGGKLTIETAMTELDERSAAARPDMKPGRYLMLAVSDTGRGMDAATCERIFEPFFSTKGERGTGLGLATVFGIVKQHGGNIWVYSEPGKGTTCKIYLPVLREGPAEETETEQTAGDMAGTETILLVEDDEEVRRLAGAILERKGYTVLSAENGPAALTVLQSHEGPLHLLLTDVVMPGINGKELYLEVSKQHPSIKVLYMSGYTNNVIAHRGVLESRVPYLQKPFTIQALAAKVREVIDR